MIDRMDGSWSFLIVILILLVGINLVHERVVLIIHHILIGIDRDVVQVDSKQYLIPHYSSGRVIGELDIEETCVCLGKSLVLVGLVSQHGLDHETDVVSLVLLAVYGKTLLPPAESDDL